MLPNLQLLGSLRSPLAAARRRADTTTADHRRAARQSPGRDAGKLLFTPILQPGAQETWLNSQGLADRFEGKGAVALLAAGASSLAFAQSPSGYQPGDGAHPPSYVNSANPQQPA